MSISIDNKKCINCKKCLKICPGNLIKSGEIAPEIKNPKDCWGCLACMKECNNRAIVYKLGIDQGGKGGSLTLEDGPEKIIWTIEKINGERIILDTLKTKSNKY